MTREQLYRAKMVCARVHDGAQLILYRGIFLARLDDGWHHELRSDAYNTAYGCRMASDRVIGSRHHKRFRCKARAVL